MVSESKKLFRQETIPDQFRRDISTLQKLNHEKIDHFIDLISQRKYLLASYSKEETKRLAEALSVSSETLDGLRRATIFFLYNAIHEELASSEIHDELEQHEFEIADIQNCLILIQKLESLRDRFNNELIIRRQMFSVIPTINSINSIIDMRPIYNEEKKLINIEPMVIIELSNETNIRKNEEIIFQISPEAFNILVDDLLETKQKIKELILKVKIIS